MSKFTAISRQISQTLPSILEAFTKSKEAVCSTMGPFGRTVLIHGNFHPVNTKDGITALEHCVWEDTLQRVVQQLLLDAARKTVQQEGDGTTTTVLLASKLAEVLLPKIQEGGFNPHKVAQALEEVKEEFIDYMRAIAQPATDRKTLVNVATLSANNDPMLGELIGDLAAKVGVYGSIIALPSPTSRTYTETITGWSVDGEQPLPMAYEFLTNQAKRCSEIENPYVLLVEMEMNTYEGAFNNILQQWIELYKKDRRPLVIICHEMNQGVLSTVLANFMNNKLPIYVIRAPYFGEKRKAVFEDMKVVMGANKTFSFSTGNSLKDFQISALGNGVEKLTLYPHRLIVESKKDMVKNKLDHHKKVLLEQANDVNLTTEMADFYKQRIARLDSGIGFIFVGGATKIEHDALMMAVDDAYKACFSALRGGVVAGGGATMLRIAHGFREDLVNERVLPLDAGKSMSEYQLAKDAIRQALKAPLENILTLANISQEKQKEIKTHLLNIIIGEGGKTYSVLTEQFVNASEAGIIEPANVPIAALTNAISIIKNLATMEYCLQIVEEGK